MLFQFFVVFLHYNKKNNMKTLRTVDLWVVYRQSSTDLDELYLNKEDAELVCNKSLTELFGAYRKYYEFLNDEQYEIHFNTVYGKMFTVITLEEALMYIKDEYSECPNCQDESL